MPDCVFPLFFSRFGARRPLRCIENYITEHVYTMYANTHTTTTITSKQTTQFRHEARELIRSCVNATEDDAVIFTGSGSTGAIHKLLNVMELHGEKASKTMVLVGPFEHHSNILPWRESGARVSTCLAKVTLFVGRQPSGSHGTPFSAGG